MYAAGDVSVSGRSFFGCLIMYRRDLRQKFAKVGVYFLYISCCGFTAGK